MSDRNHILIIDDDADHRVLYSRFLEEAGYATQGVDSAEEAFERLNAEPFDLVLTDWFLTGKRGNELITELRRVNIPVKTILMSSHLHVRHAAESCGADGCFRKHDDINDLLALIARLLPVG
ncbi:MAG: response regulator [Armatimonadota bacterium]